MWRPLADLRRGEARGLIRSRRPNSGPPPTQRGQLLNPASKLPSEEKTWPIANTFFADVAKQLGHNELAKLFRETAAQETEHAFAHFRLLHPELVVGDAAKLSDD
jgi:hypothetical protein